MRRPLVRLLALPAVLGLAFLITVLILGRSAEDLRDAVGSIGPLGFVAVLAALTVVLFPYPVGAGVAGVLFGAGTGTAVAVAGGTIGAVLAFGIARATGRAPLELIASERLKHALETVGRRGFGAVLILRAAPGVPRDATNYALGLTPVGLIPFGAATLIGIGPRAFAYASLGGSLGNLGSPESLLAVGLLVAFGIFGLALVARDPELRSLVRRPERNARRPDR
ncbi:MAG: TVP38/TMEM64 family protein [Solirubrobacterales bacterium]